MLERIGQLLSGVTEVDSALMVLFCAGLTAVLLGAFLFIRRQNRAISELLKLKTDELQMSEAAVRQLAYFDSLTGLPNRRMLLETLEKDVYDSERYHRSGAVFYIDLDNFKNINDTLGHEHGDKLLVELAHRLAGTVRRSDTVARLGADEFAVLMHSEAQSEEKMVQKVNAVLHKLLGLSEMPYVVDGQKHFLTFSVGVNMYPSEGASAQELLTQADTALYRAKSIGKNTACFFHQDMQRMAERKLSMERDMREALEQDQFYLVFQPQVDSGGRVLGTEALIRWRRLDGSQVSPGEFIPVAEETGLILSIGKWVLEAACWQMKAWLDAGMPLAQMSVNVSPKQFQHPDFVSQVEGALKRAGLPPQYLMLELTESVVVESLSEAKAKMDQLIEIGVRTSMDDFGTGYSSLSYLTELPFHELKIDQSFVRNLFNDKKNSAITKTIIAMARSLELVVLAEGVEEQEQLDFLDRHHCSLYQGFLFSRPLPADEVVNLLAPARPLAVATH